MIIRLIVAEEEWRKCETGVKEKYCRERRENSDVFRTESPLRVFIKACSAVDAYGVTRYGAKPREVLTKIHRGFLFEIIIVDAGNLEPTMSRLRTIAVE